MCHCTRRTKRSAGANEQGLREYVQQRFHQCISEGLLEPFAHLEIARIDLCKKSPRSQFSAMKPSQEDDKRVNIQLRPMISSFV